MSPTAATRSRYSILAIGLHWLIAALIILQIVIAGRMEGPPTPERFAIVQLHKSVGITVLFLSLLRLAWRLAHPPPPLPPTLASWERSLARWTHVGFYAVMIGMPLTGWIIVSTSRIQLPTLLYGVAPWPMIPGLPELAPAAKKLWHAIGEQGHGLIIKLAYVLIALHIAGALKHQWFRPDEPVLARMAPGAKPGRRAEPRLLLIAAGALVAVLLARFVQPPRPGVEPAPPPAAPRPATEAAPPQPAAAAPPVAEPPAPAPSAPAAPAAPLRWTVEPGSRLGFETAWSGTPVRGRFERWRAEILFSPDALEQSRIRVAVDMASAATGDAQRDQTLPAADWFDSAAHPQAIFSATRIRKAGEARYLADGTLQLKGVSRPAILPFRVRITGAKAEADGALVLDRTAFGVGEGPFASTEQVPAKVEVTVHVLAHAPRMP